MQALAEGVVRNRWSPTPQQDPALLADDGSILTLSQWGRVQEQKDRLQRLMRKQNRKTLPGLYRYDRLQRLFEHRNRVYHMVSVAGEYFMVTPALLIEWRRWGTPFTVVKRGKRSVGERPQAAMHSMTRILGDLRHFATRNKALGFGAMIQVADQIAEDGYVKLAKRIRSIVEAGELSKLETLSQPELARAASYFGF